MHTMTPLSFDDAVRLHQEGKSAEAEEVYRPILQREPDHAGALHLLGVVRHQRGRHEEALGLIGLGRVPERDSPLTIRFYCEEA